MKQDIICSGVPDAEMLGAAVGEFLRTVRPERQRLFDYYRGEQTVNKGETVRGRPDNRLRAPFPRYITEVHTGYFLGLPPTLAYGDAAAGGRYAELSRALDLPHLYFDLGRDLSICGAGFALVWAERSGVQIVKHGEGADPAAVVFDAAASFKARKRDILLCDTAGRLHNKKNLMSELEKIRRVLDRELPGVPVEALLVLDATTGQNAIIQARAFGESTGLTGVIITKLDGTAKGGMAVAIKNELGLPVRFIGVGEGIDDLRPFDADAFAEALI